MKTSPTLQTFNLGYKREQRFLFSNLNMSLNAGECLIVEGENGSGKTSLLRLLTTLATPDVGEIFWQEQNIAQHRQAYLQNLHYVGHQLGIKLGLTVEENLKLAAPLSTPTAIQQVLQLWQLEKYSNILTSSLSAGQKKRVALVRLHLQPRNMWILDEPFSALDKAAQSILQDSLIKHLDQGGIAAFSSHQPIEISSSQRLRLSPC